MRINNLKRLELRRKELRNNLTPAEAKLWIYLKSSRIGGRKFRRQHSVGGYVLDFYCPEEKLCIELDGNAHYTETECIYDKNRTGYLNAAGIKVIRFENRLVFDNPDGVIAKIRRQFTTPDPSLTRRGA
jgi:very-short-patch-repair endonuclease